MQAAFLEEPSTAGKSLDAVRDLDRTGDDAVLYFRPPALDTKLAFAEWIAAPERRRDRATFAAFGPILEGLRIVLSERTSVSSCASGRVVPRQQSSAGPMPKRCTPKFLPASRRDRHGTRMSTAAIAGAGRFWFRVRNHQSWRWRICPRRCFDQQHRKRLGRVEARRLWHVPPR